MTTLLIMLQGIFAAMIASCILVLLVAAVRYMLADPKDRVLIVDAPERGNVIPFRNTRLKAQGSTLSFKASHNPSRGGH
ncbi:hypothetical protein [Rhizobium leguminosarum]